MKELTKTSTMKILIYTLLLSVVMVLGSCHGPYIDKGCIITDAGSISKEYTQYKCTPDGSDHNGYGPIEFKDVTSKFRVGDTLYMSKEHIETGIIVPNNWNTLSTDSTKPDLVVAYRDSKGIVHLKWDN